MKTKRRKAWVNFYAGEGPRPNTWGTHLGTKATVRMAAQEGAEQLLLVESRPGDVVLSREQVAHLMAITEFYPVSSAALAEVRALLRGGR